MTVLFGIRERARTVHRLPTNPARDMEKPTQRRRAGLDRAVSAFTREA
jgi:hypothetical protein